MNLEDYLDTHAVAGSDPFSLRRFGAQLLLIRRSAKALVELIDSFADGHGSTIDVDLLCRACDLAEEVAEFFPREFHLGGQAYGLVADLRHTITKASIHPTGFDVSVLFPPASARVRNLRVRAHRLERYLRTHGSGELACNFGRSRTLYDNVPWIVSFTGVTTGAGAYFLLTIISTLWWLNGSFAFAIGSLAAACASSAIFQVIDGKRVVLSWPLIALTLRMIPVQHRLRYAEEFRADLYIISPWQQLVYSFNQLSRAMELRSSLAEERTLDADSSSEF